MAVSDGVRELVGSVRARRALCVASYSNGSLSLADVVHQSKSDPALHDLYLVKLLEANPEVGKVRARRILGDLGLPPMTVIAAIDNSTLSELDDAVRVAMASRDRS